MADPSGYGSNTHQRHGKISLEEHSLSSQESTNHANQCPVSGCHKHGESKAGSRTAGPFVSEPSSSTGQHKIVPLSGNPYFTCIITRSHIHAPFQMIIPKSFHQFLPSSFVPVVLSCRGKDWVLMYYGDRSLRRFDAGWRKFAEDNNLKVGDGCVLELMDDKNLKFRVQILSGEIPDLIDDSGRSYESPIMIN